MSDEEYAEFNRQKQKRIEAMRKCAEPNAKKRKIVEIKSENPPRWPAKEGLFLNFCGFLFGLCSKDKFKEYMVKFGTDIGLNEDQMNYMFFMFEIEQNLEYSMKAMIGSE